MSQTLRLSLYHTLLELRFEAGRLVAVERGSPEQASDARLPPALLAPLALGYRGFDELDGFYHDVSADGRGRSTLAILFPPMMAFLYTIY
jgi:hypothetical protein